MSHTVTAEAVDCHYVGLAGPVVTHPVPMLADDLIPVRQDGVQNRFLLLPALQCKVHLVRDQRHGHCLTCEPRMDAVAGRRIVRGLIRDALLGAP